MSTFDLPISISVLNNLKSGPLDFFFSNITHLGDGWFWILFCLGLFFFRQTRIIGFVCLTALIIDFGLCEVIKVIVARARPFQVYPVQLLISAPRGYSFPSNHSSTSFAVATSFFAMGTKKPYRSVRWFVLLLAALIALSRVYLFVHYLSDIIVGGVIGTLVAVICVKLYKKYRSRINGFLFRF